MYPHCLGPALRVTFSSFPVRDEKQAEFFINSSRDQKDELQVILLSFFKLPFTFCTLILFSH